MAVGFGGENILLKSTEPNFVRDVIKTYAELISMNANHENNYDVGHIVFCEETGEHYVYLGSGYGGSENTVGDTWRRVDHFLKFDTITNFQDQLSIGGFPYGKLALVNNKALIYAGEDFPVLLAAKFDSVNDISEWEDLGVALEGAYVSIGGHPYYINGNYEVIKISDERDLSDKQDKLSTSTKLFTLNGTNVYFGGSATIETGGGGGSDCSCNFVVVEGSDEFEDFGDWNTAFVSGEELETQGSVSGEELEVQGTVANEELTM